jgi:hypothetical protein
VPTLDQGRTERAREGASHAGRLETGALALVALARELDAELAGWHTQTSRMPAFSWPSRARPCCPLSCHSGLATVSSDNEKPPFPGAFPVRLAGFEPATRGLEVRCSVH